MLTGDFPLVEILRWHTPPRSHAVSNAPITMSSTGSRSTKTATSIEERSSTKCVITVTHSAPRLGPENESGEGSFLRCHTGVANGLMGGTMVPMRGRIVALLVGIGLVVFAPLPNSSAEEPPAQAGTVLAVLDTLPVKGRAPMTGYSRDLFGGDWSDVDGNGCDTRSDVLRRDLVERVMSSRCGVMSGVLYPDPFTGRPLTYVRGRSVVDVDHVVSLGNAWATGAQQLSPTVRIQLANDPLNLLAVSASANRQKQDGDAATWLPANKAFRCAYVARQIAVKSKYRLWITSAEKSAIQRVLAPCPLQRIPTDGTLPDPAPAIGGAPSSSGVSEGRYRTCADARAAGVTPIRRDTDPRLYAVNSHMDRDSDGVACE